MAPTPARRSPRRPSGGERVFADDAGLLWSAAVSRTSDGAVIFSCITDSRQSVRALALDPATRIADVADETLRAWLQQAPRIGRLT